MTAAMRRAISRNLGARNFGPALLLLALAGCAGPSTRADDAFNAAAATLPKKYPACADEIKAFVALTRLATQLSGTSDVLGPALEALRDQVMDCVEDSYPNPQPIRSINPAPAAANPSAPSHNTRPARPIP
jgi:hypothetical protein